MCAKFQNRQRGQVAALPLFPRPRKATQVEGARRMDDPEIDGVVGRFEGLTGEIVEVTGRLAEGGRAGLPAIEKIT